MEKLTFLGLLCALLACNPEDTPSKPPATPKNEPTTIPKLPTPPLTLTKQKWQQDKEWGGQESDEFPSKDNNQPWADVPFDTNTLIEVKRSDALFNPWQGTNPKNLHIAYQGDDRGFVAKLPPRYLEDGHEWRLYYSFNLGKKSFYYVGLPSNKKADYTYDVRDDGKYHINISIRQNKDGKRLYQQRLVLQKVSDRHIVPTPSEYHDELEGVFAGMADEKGTEWGGGRYHFTAPRLQELHRDIKESELRLHAGCPWQKLDRYNLYQWGNARLDFLGRPIRHAKTFCSDKLVAVAYLLETEEVKDGGFLVEKVIDDRLMINVFDKQTLKPFDGSDFSPYIDHDIKDGLANGSLSVQHIDVVKQGDKYEIRATLSDGQVILE